MASQMVRKQIYIKKRQDVMLKQLSQARGLSEAEIIRQALERETGMRVTPIGERSAAWAQILEFMQERKRALAGGGKPVRWERREIYQERETRWFRIKDGE